MKFLLMVITDEAAEAALSPAEIDALVERHTAFAGALRADGMWVTAARLRYGRDAITLRRRGGRTVTLDGPFAESKEVLGGFYLIEAASRDAAIERAKQLPLDEHGAVEVRPARTGATWRGPLRGAKQFAVLFIANADKPISRAEMFASIDTHYETSLDLAAQGRFVSSRALEPSPAAATIRWTNGRHVVSDGPFAETKEFVAGYFVIASDSTEEALDWAQRLLGANDACEVRPLWGPS